MSSRRAYYRSRKYPRWLWPRCADLLPFLKPQQVAARLANSRGRFRALDPAERAARLAEIGAKGAAVAREVTTEEQRRAWASAAGRLGNAVRWGNNRGGRDEACS